MKLKFFEHLQAISHRLKLILPSLISYYIIKTFYIIKNGTFNRIQIFPFQIFNS